MDLKFYDGNGRLSHGVVVGDMVYLCGSCADDFSGDIAAQTKEALASVEAKLAKYGSDKEHIASILIFISDMKNFAAMNAVYDKWVVPGKEPARTCVQASASSPDILLEMVVTAVKK